MNLASWIILAILIVIMALALRSSLPKRKKGGCCKYLLHFRPLP